MMCEAFVSDWPCRRGVYWGEARVTTRGAGMLQHVMGCLCLALALQQLQQIFTCIVLLCGCCFATDEGQCPSTSDCQAGASLGEDVASQGPVALTGTAHRVRVVPQAYIGLQYTYIYAYMRICWGSAGGTLASGGTA